MSLRGQLKQAWNALAYADAGEFLPYAEKCRVLGVEPPPDCVGYLPPRERAPRRAVALHLGAGVSRRTLEYAFETCRRVDATLVLLAGSETEVAPWLDQASAEGVPHRLERLTGHWTGAVSSYLKDHPEVIFLIVSPDDLNAQAAHRRRGPRWLPSVPLVVVDQPLPQAGG